MEKALPASLRAEIDAAMASTSWGISGIEDHVGAPGEPGAQRQPPDGMAHDLDHDDPVVGVGRRVEAIDGIGGDPHGGVEAKGDVGAGDVVVDGLGHGQDRDPDLLQLEGVAHRAVPAQADQGVHPVLLDDLSHHRAPVHHLAIGDLHLVHLRPAGAEHRASPGEDPRQRVLVEAQEAVLHEPLEAVFEPDDLHPVGSLGGFADGTYRSVETGAVPARGQDANGSGHCRDGIHPSRHPRFRLPSASPGPLPRTSSDALPITVPKRLVPSLTSPSRDEDRSQRANSDLLPAEDPPQRSHPRGSFRPGRSPSDRRRVVQAIQHQPDSCSSGPF